MQQLKRPRLSHPQKRCLRMIGEHGLTGSHTEFSRAHTRRTIHALFRKKLVQRKEYRWIVTPAGDAEYKLLVMEAASEEGSL